MMDIMKLGQGLFVTHVVKDDLTLGVHFLDNYHFKFIASQYLFVSNTAIHSNKEVNVKKMIVKGSGTGVEPTTYHVVCGASNVYNTDMIKFLIHIHHTFEAFFANKTIKAYKKANYLDYLKSKKNNSRKVASKSKNPKKNNKDNGIFVAVEKTNQAINKMLA